MYNSRKPQEELIKLKNKENTMEFIIAEEGLPINIGYQGASIAYYGSEIELSYETVPPHGDEIFSASLPLLGIKLPFWMYGRNLIFLDAYYLLVETVEAHTWDPITSRLINIHTGESASLGDWYNNVKVKANCVELKNDFTGETMILKDVKKLSWV